MNKLLEWCFKTETKAMMPILARHLEEMYRSGPESGSMHLYQKGTIPILMVGHIDTVHHGMPEEIYYDQEKGVAWSPDGIGADDRAGIYGILELLRRGHRPHILFTDEEERGGLGAEQATRQLDAPDVNLMIELDRMNATNAVWYSCENGKARKWVNKFGFKTAEGSFTDISVLMPEWKIAGVNLSIGYYNQHSTSEILNVFECHATIDKVEQMLLSPPDKRFHYHARKERWKDWNSFKIDSRLTAWGMEMDSLALRQDQHKPEPSFDRDCDGCNGKFACEDLSLWEGNLLCGDCLGYFEKADFGIADGL